MANPFTAPTISGYNSSPPSDDGNQVSANQVKWATHKTKLTDPLKTFVDDLITNTNTAFATVDDASNLTTGELPDARLSSKVPLKDAANEFTDNQTISSASPALYFEETDAGPDEKLWRFVANADAFNLQLRTDADGAGSGPLAVRRTGTNIDSFEITADSITATGAVAITGATAITGALTATSYGGITEANLVDKSATETIAGTWTFSDIATATFSGNIAMTGTRAIDATTRLNLTGATVSVGEAAGALGFYGIAGVGIQTVSGSKENNLALDSLINALTALGLISDNTTD